MDHDLQSRRLARNADTTLGYLEAVLYIGVSVLLVVGGGALLFEAGKAFVTDMGDGVVWAATRMLSILLLVFVFVELLGAVRSTVLERRLVAEPFLLVGIIASIKEIVLIGGTQQQLPRDPTLFRDAMIEVAILAGIVLVLAVATFLLRYRARADEHRPA